MKNIATATAPKTRSLETIRSTDKGYRVAGWDFKDASFTETVYFELFFATQDEATTYAGKFVMNKHKAA